MKRTTREQDAQLARGLEGRRIAVVGATGAVGAEAIALLAGAGVEPGRVRAYASKRAEIAYGDGVIPVEPAEPPAIDADTAVLAVSSELARTLAPALVERGLRVIDNSSAMRMDPGVPLVVPEINAAAAGDAPLVANPNCTTIISLVAVEPLRQAFGIRALSVTSYQAVSGAGRAGIEALERETAAALAGDPPEPGFFPHPCAFNVFPHESELDPASGACMEEIKFVRETRKIWSTADADADQTPAGLDATCVRVPTRRTHLIVARLELAQPATRRAVLEVLRRGEGVRLSEHGPTALEAAGRCDVFVGRVRGVRVEPDEAGPPRRDWRLIAAGDQLLKGAAWNALQIAAGAAP